MGRKFSQPDETAQEGPQEARSGIPADELTARLSAVTNAVIVQQFAAEQGWTAGRLAFRCTPGYAVWVGALSTWTSVPAATVIDQAIRRFAESVGFPAPPPPRLPCRTVGTPTAQTIADFRGYHGVAQDLDR